MDTLYKLMSRISFSLEVLHIGAFKTVFFVQTFDTTSTCLSSRRGIRVTEVMWATRFALSIFTQQTLSRVVRLRNQRACECSSLELCAISKCSKMSSPEFLLLGRKNVREHFIQYKMNQSEMSFSFMFPGLKTLTVDRVSHVILLLSWTSAPPV